MVTASFLLSSKNNYRKKKCTEFDTWYKIEVSIGINNVEHLFLTKNPYKAEALLFVSFLGPFEINKNLLRQYLNFVGLHDFFHVIVH